MAESFLSFTNSSILLVFLKYHLKCLSLTPCITKIKHVWEYHLIFFFCKFIIYFFLFGICSTKGAAVRKEPHNRLCNKSCTPSTANTTQSCICKVFSSVFKTPILKRVKFSSVFVIALSAAFQCQSVPAVLQYENVVFNNGTFLAK